VVDVKNCDLCKQDGFELFVEVQPVIKQFYKEVAVSGKIENSKNNLAKSRTKTFSAKNQNQGWEFELAQNEISSYSETRITHELCNSRTT
jgi:hypothetical protein